MRTLVAMIERGFETEPHGARIPAVVLRERLALTMRACGKRYEDAPEIKELAVASYRAFVELAERKERETGKPCIVYASY